MSHIHVRKMCGSKYSYAGREWWYSFSPSFDNFGKEAVNKFIASKQRAFSKKAKSWNCELNSEWLVRAFFSAKMILAASLMLESLEYSREKNLKVCVPYLQYYSLLYSLKSLVLMLPGQKWNNGELIKQTHKKTINIACDEITKISPHWSKNVSSKALVKTQIFRLKALREMISYRAPSSGGKLCDYSFDVHSLCITPVELTQMISEILECSLHKYLPKGFKPELDSTALKQVYCTMIDGYEFFDQEDAYRIDYLFRKYPMPTNILHIMPEGHVEDFFGSWCEDTPQDDSFNPDDSWQILFDVP